MLTQALYQFYTCSCTGHNMVESSWDSTAQLQWVYHFFFSFFWFLISFVMNETMGISECMLHEEAVAELIFV